MASALSLGSATPPPASGVIPKGAGTRGTADGRRNLVALGSAAVVAIYAAGYVHTQSAADRFASESAVRRPASSGGGVRGEGVPSPAVTASRAADAVTAVAPQARTAAGRVEAATSTSASTSAIVAKSATSLGTDDSAKSASLSGAAAQATHAELSTAATADSAPPTTLPVVATSAASTAVSASVSATAAAPATAPSQAAVTAWRDGFFFGRGTSRHGDIEAMVEIKDGRIMSAVISQCLTRYSCSWIAALPGQVVARQNADVDYVSGATQSANAFYYAIVEALKQAK